MLKVHQLVWFPSSVHEKKEINYLRTIYFHFRTKQISTYWCLEFLLVLCGALRAPDWKMVGFWKRVPTRKTYLKMRREKIGYKSFAPFPPQSSYHKKHDLCHRFQAGSVYHIIMGKNCLRLISTSFFVMINFLEDHERMYRRCASFTCVRN